MLDSPMGRGISEHDTIAITAVGERTAQITSDTTGIDGGDRRRDVASLQRGCTMYTGGWRRYRYNIAPLPHSTTTTAICTFYIPAYTIRCTATLRTCRLCRRRSR